MATFGNDRSGFTINVKAIKRVAAAAPKLPQNLSDEHLACDSFVQGVVICDIARIDGGTDCTSSAGLAQIAARCIANRADQVGAEFLDTFWIHQISGEDVVDQFCRVRGRDAESAHGDPSQERSIRIVNRIDWRRVSDRIVSLIA